jgi:hypothetical protein
MWAVTEESTTVDTYPIQGVGLVFVAWEKFTGLDICNGGNPKDSYSVQNVQGPHNVWNCWCGFSKACLTLPMSAVAVEPNGLNRQMSNACNNNTTLSIVSGKLRWLMVHTSIPCTFKFYPWTTSQSSVCKLDLVIGISWLPLLEWTATSAYMNWWNVAPELSYTTLGTISESDMEYVSHFKWILPSLSN